eukprot:2441093-Rhodomonas_salina.3
MGVTFVDAGARERVFGGSIAVSDDVDVNVSRRMCSRRCRSWCRVPSTATTSPSSPTARPAQVPRSPPFPPPSPHGLFPRDSTCVTAWV